MKLDLVMEALYHVIAVYFVYFLLLKSINKVLNPHKATANFDKYMVSFLNFDVNFSLSKFVDAFRFAHEHNLLSLILWLRVDE